VKSALHFLLPCAAALSVSGCMSIYHMTPGSPAATLEIQKGATAWICDNAPPQLLVRDKQGLVAIPADKRVTLGVNFYSSDGYMTYSCSPSVSLVPETGARYYQDFETEGEACTAFVYRKTDDKRIGLAFEPSLGQGGPSCVAK
jgi:hypothetical protein